MDVVVTAGLTHMNVQIQIPDSEYASTNQTPSLRSTFPLTARSK